MKTRNRSSWFLIGTLAVTGALPLSGCHSTTKGTKAPPKDMERAPIAAHGTYFDVSEIPYATLLPTPPEKGTAVSRGEVELLLAIQSDAGPHVKPRAVSEETISVWTFAEVMGPAFDKAKLPIIEDVMKKVEKDTKAVSDEAKDHWSRPRPPLHDDRVQPYLSLPKSATYPSGHATRAMVWARLLAELEPSKRQELRRRAGLVGLDRIAGGVHFPLDVAAGFGLGDAVADRFLASPKFQADLARMKAEWAAVKGGK